jgi:hypothetical protein
MLNVFELSDKVFEKIEIDPYIPIKIKWGDWDILVEETIYWRTGDFKKSLIEIGIASKSGLLRSLTVVHSDKIYFKEKSMNLTDAIEEGIPKFIISDWPECGRKDECGLFEIYYQEDEVNLILSTNKVSKKVVSGKVSFGLDDISNVCIVSINELSSEEKIQIKDTLEYIKSQNKM